MRLMHRYNLHYAPPSYPQAPMAYIDKVLCASGAGCATSSGNRTGSTVLLSLLKV